MSALLDGEMAAGALGLSSGLEYDPGIYSSTDELVALARVAARHGGRYISHVRSEDRHFWAAVDELIAIGRRAGLPVQLSREAGDAGLWGRADSLIAMLDRRMPQESGQPRRVRVYWQSTLTVLFPDRNFQDTAAARFALTEVTTPDSAILGDFEPDSTLAGKSIAEISALRHTDPAVTLMDLIAEAGKPKPGGGEYDESVVAVSMVQADIDRLWRWPFANVCSDGSLNGAHPRGFGAFPRFFRMAVRERRLLSRGGPPDDIAYRDVGITNRGRIAPGWFADLVLLDTAALADGPLPKPASQLDRCARCWSEWCVGLQWRPDRAFQARYCV
jgi:N-acyl-D-amino-acid deacylase